MPFRELDLLPDAVLIHVHGRWRYANPAAFALLGTSDPDKVLDRHILDFVPPDQHAVIAERSERSASGLLNGAAESRLLRPDGSVIDVEVAAVPFPLDGERGVLLMIRDITERREADQRFRATFEQAAVGMAHVDLRGRFLRVNARLCAIVGYECDELLTRTFQEITHADDLESDIEHVEQLLRGEIATYTMEKRYLRKDGSVVWIGLTGSLVRRPDGEPDYFIVAIEDISERKAAVARLEASEERFRNLVEHGFDLIHVVDENGVILYTSESVRHLLGRDPRDLIAMSAFSFVHPDDLPGCLNAFRQLLAHPERRQSVAIRVERADGVWRLYELSGVNLIANPAVRGVVINGRDITDRTQLENDLERLRRVESLGRVAATVAHEFNNLLMSVDMRAQMLGRAAGNADRTAQLGKEIRAAVERGKGITASVLRYATPAEPAFEEVPVSEWLAALADELRAVLAPAHSLTFQADPAIGRIAADRQQLSQVISNLVLNARDASPAGSAVHLQATRGAELAGGRNWIDIRVSDRGIGIPDEMMERIFEPLFTTKRTGTGLGLAVAQQIVTRHRGRILVENRQGGGTTFIVRLPLVQAS